MNFYNDPGCCRSIFLSSHTRQGYFMVMTIDESIQEILKTEDIVSGKFYDRFFSECPHLRQFFEGVDMNRQASMLTSAIVLVETVHSKEAGGLSPYLRLLGRQHQERGISKSDFKDWSDSMIGTLADFHGEKWHALLEAEWRQAITTSVGVMLDGYDQSQKSATSAK